MNSFFARAQRSRSLYRMLGFTAPLLILIAVSINAAQTRGLIKVKSITLGLVSRTSQKAIEAHFQEFVRRIMEQTDNTTKFDLLPGGEPQVRRKLVETFRGR